MTQEPSDYMEKCPYCNQYLLTNQRENHVCNAPIIDVREIPVLFAYETEEPNGDKLIIARGFDGVLYRLVRCKNPLLFKPSDDWKHSEESDGEVPEPSCSI